MKKDFQVWLKSQFCIVQLIAKILLIFKSFLANFPVHKPDNGVIANLAIFNIIGS